MRPILSATQTYNFALAKWLDTKLKPVSLNHYTATDLFEFADGIRNLEIANGNILIGFVPRVFPVYQRTLRWNYTASLERSFHKQLTQYNVRFESHQNGSWGPSQCSYQCTTFPVQRSPVRTDWWRGYGVPLGPLLANVLMSHIEENLDQEGKLPWSFDRRYIDDTLTVMPNIGRASNFLDTLNKASFSVKFTMETGYSGMLPFLGIQLLNQSPQIEAKLYMKPTRSGLLLHYQSHVDNR